MKVRAGRLSDADRELIIAANRERHNVLVAALDASVTDWLAASDSRGAGQYVGVPQVWTYDALHLGSVSGSFEVVIPWTAIRGVWRLDVAPSSDDVERLLRA